MKKLLLCIYILSFITCCFAGSTLSNQDLVNLEKTFNTKIGIYAIDTATNNIVEYRSMSYFLCKVLLRWLLLQLY